jgi:hypothetical protein
MCCLSQVWLLWKFSNCAAGGKLSVAGVAGIKVLSELGAEAGIGHRITGRRSGMINHHRGIGWEYLHVAVDDASRLAYSARRSGPTTNVGPGSQARAPTSARPARSPSSRRRSPGSRATASRSSGS